MSNRLTSTSFRSLFNNMPWTFTFVQRIAPTAFILMLALTIVANTLPAVTAWVSRQLINGAADIINNQLTSLEPVIPWLVAALVLGLMGELAANLSRFIQSNLADKILVETELAVLDHARNLEIALFEDVEFQDILERAQQNPQVQFTTFLMSGVGLFGGVIQAISLAAVLFLIDPLIVAVLFILVIPYAGLRIAYSRDRVNKEYARSTQRRWMRYFLSTLLRSSWLLEVRLLNLAPVLIGKFKELAGRFMAQDRQFYVRDLVMKTGFAVTFVTALYLMLFRIMQLVIDGNLTIGDIALFTGVLIRIRGLANQLTDQMGTAVESSLFTRNIRAFLETPARSGPDTPISHAHAPQTILGEIAFEDVSFIYPGTEQYVLRDLSLHIRAGETIALVGENGAGKSTLVKLIAGFYQPIQGRITLDGIDLQEYPVDLLRSHIAFVFQQFNRYEASAKDNIAYGNWEQIISLEQVREIARAADIDALIEAMPDGYETALGRQFGEFELSGGEWQRVALARALARTSATILILDEPTSNVDARAEHKLFQKFHDIAAGRTTILISHRFSTVGLADRIIVLDRGHIVESGTHRDLIARDGLYATFYGLHRELDVL